MDRRTKFRQNLSDLYLPFYDKLCSLLPAHWQPYQGYRTFSQQNALYDQGRTIPGKIVSNAPGGESAHCYGCATDWILWDVNDQPVWIGASDPAWSVYIDAVKECGLKPGIDFGDIDHNEVNIKCSWPDILVNFNSQGMDAAQSFIRRMMV